MADDGFRSSPAEQVRPPHRRPGGYGEARVRSEHLYKTTGLLFLLAALYHYLELIVRVLLIGYAAVILAVLFNAILRQVPLDRKWKAGLLGGLIFGSAGALFWFGVPLLADQVRALGQQIPAFSALVTDAEAWIQRTTGFRINLVGARIREVLGNATLSTDGQGPGLVARARGLLEYLLMPLLILFGALYAAGKPNQGLLSPLLRAAPRDLRPSLHRAAELLGQRLLGYVVGVLIGMVAVGVLSFFGYWLAGVPSPPALAVLAGLTEAIPLVGPWVGGAIATTVGLLHDPTTGLYAALVAIAVQQIEGNLIIPWVMSEAARVHPFVTLFALLLFGSRFGVLGVFLAIPLVLLIATSVQVLWVERAIDTDEDWIEPVVQD